MTTVMGWGTVWLESRSGNQIHQIILQDVLHVPAAQTNLVSGILLNKAESDDTYGEWYTRFDNKWENHRHRENDEGHVQT
jgi:hypothetical protein